MTWATTSDLLVGDMAFPATFDKQRYLNDAASEMTVRMGLIYELPLPAANTLSAHIQAVLKLIQSRLASGRLIMNMAIGAEQADLHAYGRNLVDLAYDDLNRVGREYDITGATRLNTGDNRAPSVVTKHLNTVSPFDIYEKTVHTDAPPDYWDIGY